MPERNSPKELGRAELLVLAAGVALAIIPSLPFVQSDAALFVRFHHWAIFVGGLLTGAVLMRARTLLEQ